MAHLDTRLIYHLELNTEEMRITGLALLGRLRKKDDALAARRINNKLQQAKARLANVIKDAAERNAEGATVALSEAAKEYQHGSRAVRRSRHR